MGEGDAMSAVTTPPVAAPWRRRLLRTGLILAVLAGVFAAWSVYDHRRMHREWREACAEADRLDPGWRWDDWLAAHPAMPDERNSAVHGHTALALLSAGAKNELLRIYIDCQQAPPNHRPSPQAFASLRALLTAAAPTVAEVGKVADCPEGRIEPLASPLIRSRAAYLVDYLDVVKRLLFGQLILQAEDGDPDAALTAVRAMVHSSRPLADGRDLLSVMYAAAVRVITAYGVERILAQCEPSLAALDSARRLLESEINRPLMLGLFQGERATIEDTLRAFDEGRVSRAEVGKSGLLAVQRPWTGWGAAGQWLDWLTGSDFRRADAAPKLRHLNWIIETLKESPDALQARAAEWTALQAQLPQGVADWAAMMARYDADLRVSEGYFRSAVAALAAEQFRRATGHWPTALDELVPQYLTAVPRDPMDGKPLRFARRPDGIVIYSIAPNGKDDGGAVQAENKKTASDIGIRLWDAAQRRQPPLPPKTPAAKAKAP
jgi:hypothetical protein